VGSSKEQMNSYRSIKGHTAMAAEWIRKHLSFPLQTVQEKS